MSPTAWMSPAVMVLGPLLLHHHALRAVALHLDGDVLDVEDDVGHVLAHAGDRGELVQHAVDVHRLHRRALQRGEENAPQRVARVSRQIRAQAARPPPWRCAWHRFRLRPAAFRGGSVLANSSGSRLHPSRRAARDIPRLPAPLSGKEKRRRALTRPPDQNSDAAALARPAAIVRDRRHVADRRHREARGLQRTQRRLTTRSQGPRPRLRACACRAPSPSWRHPPRRLARRTGSTCASP